MLERHKLLMGRTQDRAGQNNGSIGVFWRSFNGIIGHIRYMFRGLKITHNHEHSSLYSCTGTVARDCHKKNTSENQYQSILRMQAASSGIQVYHGNAHGQ